MIGYPIDSHVTYNSDGVPEYDRAISSEPLRKLYKSLFSDGVLPNPSTNMQIQAGEGMTVIVNAGFAICNGCMKLEESARTLVVQASSNSLDRIDTVILRLNNNEDVRSLDFYVLQGTPATNPVRPALARNDTIWEIGIADVFIPSNTSVISNARITDTRYETARCGIISSISKFDTTTLYNQVKADLDYFKDVSETDFDTWVVDFQRDFESWKAGEEASFNNWFATIQSQLSGDVAANLQAQIGALPTLQTQDKTDLVKAINELTTKLPSETPTSADEGKTPVVQPDGSVDWGSAKGGHDMIPVSEGVEGVERNTTPNKVVDALVVKAYSNMYTNRVILNGGNPIAEGSTYFGTWDSTSEDDWAYSEEFKVGADEDIDLAFMFEVIDDTSTPVYLGGYKWDTTSGKVCIKFGSPLASDTRIAVNVTHMRKG